MKRLGILLIIIAVHAGASAQQIKWVTAYYAGWTQGNQWSYHLRPADIDFGAVTHIVHFSLGPNPDGSLNDEGNNVNKENAAAIISAGHMASKKVLICVGGWNSEIGFAEATKAPTRTKFIDNLLNLVTNRGYDGIDIDWEPVSPKYFKQYEEFIIELRSSMMRAHSSLLLTAASGGEPVLFGRIYPYFDQINLMTYDMSGAWPSWVTWHNAPVYDGNFRFPATGQLVPSVNERVESYLRAEIPAAKLGIGIDFYGYVWNGGSGTATGGVTEPRQSWRTAPWVKDNVPYHDIMDTYFQSEYYHWDSVAQAAYLGIDKQGSADDKFISYDDETTCRKKIEYVKAKGLGGVILWELGGGWRPKTNPPDKLLQAVKEAAGWKK